MGQLPAAVTSVKQPRNEYDGLARVDYNLTSHHAIDVRTYITNADDFTSNSSASGIGVPAYEIDNNSAGIYSGNVGDTWVVRSSMLNVLRFGYKRYNYTIVPTDTTTGKDLGANFVQRGYPVLPRIEAASNRFTLGSNNSPFSYSVNANYETDDSFSWTLGNHNLQFGAQFLSLDYIHRFDQEPMLEAQDQNTGLSTADFLFGLPENDHRRQHHEHLSQAACVLFLCAGRLARDQPPDAESWPALRASVQLVSARWAIHHVHSWVSIEGLSAGAVEHRLPGRSRHQQRHRGNADP